MRCCEAIEWWTSLIGSWASAASARVPIWPCCLATATSDPLFLQVKEATVPALAPYVPPLPASLSHDGRRVVLGQRTLQASSDILIGWTTIDGRPFYVRQMRNLKGSMVEAKLRAICSIRTRRPAAFCSDGRIRDGVRRRQSRAIAAIRRRSMRLLQTLPRPTASRTTAITLLSPRPTTRTPSRSRPSEPLFPTIGDRPLRAPR